MSSNLEFIKSQTVVSGTTTINVEDVFSDKYDVYAVDMLDFYVSGGVDYFYLRLIDSGGSVISSTDYDHAVLEMKSDAAYVERYGTGGTNMVPGTNYLGDTTEDSFMGVFYFFNPFSSSTFTYMLGQSVQYEYSKLYGDKYVGRYDVNASITGFQWSVGVLSQTFQGGKIKVYGVKG